LLDDLPIWQPWDSRGRGLLGENAVGLAFCERVPRNCADLVSYHKKYGILIRGTLIFGAFLGQMYDGSVSQNAVKTPGEAFKTASFLHVSHVPRVRRVLHSPQDREQYRLTSAIGL
jgi:hypothetical protein